MKQTVKILFVDSCLNENKSLFLPYQVLDVTIII